MWMRRTMITGTTLALLAVTAGCGSAVADEAADSVPDDPAKRIQRQLDGFVDDGTVIGAGVRLRDGDRTRQPRAGLGNLTTGAKYPRDAHTRIASVTKA